MKKLLEKDKNLRFNIKQFENQSFILKSIFKNTNFFVLVRWKAFVKLHLISSKFSKVALSARCITTINRKNFNKLTPFSRHVFF
jgi:hypothetical protein